MLSQATYIDKLLLKHVIQDSKVSYPSGIGFLQVDDLFIVNSWT